MSTDLPPAVGEQDRIRLQLETIAENATLALFVMDEHQWTSINSARISIPRRNA